MSESPFMLASSFDNVIAIRRKRAIKNREQPNFGGVSSLLILRRGMKNGQNSILWKRRLLNPPPPANPPTVRIFSLRFFIFHHKKPRKRTLPWRYGQAARRLSKQGKRATHQHCVRVVSHMKWRRGWIYERAGDFSFL